MSTLCLTLFTCCSFFLLTPLLAICLTLSYLYKRIVEILLRLEYKDDFVSFLQGNDYVWAIEDSSALSVINVLVILEKDQRPRCHLKVLENFRNLVRDRLLTSRHEKVLHRRNKRYGYYFWQREKQIDLKERIRWLDHDEFRCEGTCYDDINADPLKRILGKVCNRPLPGDHATSWEILIGRDCNCVTKFNVVNNNNNNNERCITKRVDDYNSKFFTDRTKRNKVKIPVLFRIHRSLGDGTDLVKLFLETIVEKTSNGRVQLSKMIVDEEIKVKRLKDYHEITIEVPSFVKCINDKSIAIYDEEEDEEGTTTMMRSYYERVLSVTMPFAADVKTIRIFAKIFRNYINAKIAYFDKMTFEDTKKEIENYIATKWLVFKDFLSKEVRRGIESVARTVGIFLLMPGYLVQQIVRNKEINPLHGPQLSGEKVLFYWSEDDFRDSRHQKLVTKVRDIKAVSGAKFGEIFLAAFSASLNRYLLRINETPPDSLIVELPIKKEYETSDFTLKNEISNGLLPLCISKISEKRCVNFEEDSRLMERIREIMRLNDELAQDPNYVISCWIIELLSTLLPEKLLKPLLENYSTVAFTNLSECQEARILGHKVKNIVVWIPNRNTTGLCFSILSYAGRLQLSMLADKALVKEDKIFAQILGSTVHEIDKLHDSLTSTRFFKKFQAVAKASMDQDNGVLSN